MNKHEYQKDMEKLFHKNQLIPRIKREFTECKEVDFKLLMEAHNLPPEFGFDLLTQMVIHKRASLPILVGILRRHFDTLQEVADAIKVAAEINLIDYMPGLDLFKIRIDITEDVKEELERYQYPLPMIVEPRHLKKNNDSAYLTGAGSLILKNNHHDDDICLDHLNRVNQIQFRINHTTANLIQNEWKNLDKPKEDEELADYQRRVKQFQKYDRTARDVLVHLEIADNNFHLTHKYDKRGRVYSQGYHVNYQGTAWNKAVVEFYNGELVE